MLLPFFSMPAPVEISSITGPLVDMAWTAAGYALPVAAALLAVKVMTDSFKKFVNDKVGDYLWEQEQTSMAAQYHTGWGFEGQTDSGGIADGYQAFSYRMAEYSDFEYRQRYWTDSSSSEIPETETASSIGDDGIDFAEMKAKIRQSLAQSA